MSPLRLQVADRASPTALSRSATARTSLVAPCVAGEVAEVPTAPETGAAHGVGGAVRRDA